MKRTVIAFLSLLVPQILFPAGAVFDVPVYPCTDAFSVALTSFSWTLVPATNCTSRISVNLVNNSGTNIVGIVTTSNVTPSVSTMTYSIVLSTGQTSATYRFPDDSYIWLRAGNTNVAVSAMGQEFKIR